ncbi:hypothetical protein NC652_015498 [Populus alba x Populus x berolinensis]|nr:hypothetical protein NC652_015498 [Populus alba x Populus x berolinensis]
MVETQVTTMVIKVIDLGCEKCHKKIKKVLCGIPQGQSVIYGEMDVVVAEVEVTMCAEVYMFVKSTIPRRHAQLCKGKVRKTDGLSQRPASTVGFKSSGHDGPLCCCVYNIIPFVMMHDFVPS